MTPVTAAHMSARLRIDLHILIPGVAGAHDGCVDRLRALIAPEPGVSDVHVANGPDDSLTLCVHYDPAMLPLARIESLVRTAGAQVAARFDHVVLPLRAVDAEDAAGRIEETLLATPGVLAASANLAAQHVRVEYDRGATSLDRLRQILEAGGYGRARAAAIGESQSALSEGRAWLAQNRELAWSLACGGLTAAGWIGEHWGLVSPRVSLTVYVLAYVCGGQDLVRHTLGDLRRARFSFDIDLLMLLAAAGAAALGAWIEGAFLLFLFSLAHALEHYALGRARNAIRALGELAPAQARVLDEGRDTLVPIEQVQPGALVLVRPAERIPVDGVVARGRSAVDQAPITGESVPVEKGVGDEVFAGTVNGDGALEITTRRAAGDRTLDRIIQLVAEAQTQKAPTQQSTERFERIFVPVMLTADLLLMTVPPLVGVWDWSTSVYRALAMLVAASPCALALGTPAAVLAGIAQAARHGVLVKGGAHLETLAQVRALALDKTGTLTTGRPEVIEVVPIEAASAGALLRAAAAVERQSQHPLAAAIVRRAENDGLELPATGDVINVTARGVRSTLDGEPIEIGGPRLWQDSADVAATPGDGRDDAPARCRAAASPSCATVSAGLA